MGPLKRIRRSHCWNAASAGPMTSSYVRSSPSESSAVTVYSQATSTKAFTTAVESICGAELEPADVGSTCTWNVLESEPPRPMGFGPDGRFLCHLENVPDDFDIWEVGTDYALGIRESEFDVQLVAKYGLARPGAAPD